MAKTSGIQGVDHIAIFTSRVEQAERLYVELFGARVLFRGTTLRGEWVGIDPTHGWDDIRRRGLTVQASFLRAGGLTVIVSDERTGKLGPINHAGIGCTEPEYKRIKQLVGQRSYRVLERGADGFKFVDEIGVIWEVSRGMEAARRPAKMLDLRTGRIVPRRTSE